MKAFQNEGCGQCVLLEENRGILLIAAIERSEYVVAFGPLESTGRWADGEYIKDLTQAKEYYDKLTRR